MNMQARQAPTMVTVAKAAELLSAAGDKITAPNVSRYLDRHQTIKTERKGRTRQVDIVALASHRQTNISVVDKQSGRGLEPEALKIAAPVADELLLSPDDGDAETIADINLELRRIELRRKTREEDIAAGRLVPDREVLTLISTVIMTVTASLERQEAGIAQQFGREVSTAFRRTRKAAMAEAAGRLADLAKRHLPPTLAPQAVEAAESVPEAES
jgi:hypothetical protein